MASNATQIVTKIMQNDLDGQIEGVIVFGSRKESSDLDLGVIYRSTCPDIEEDMDWDLFSWSVKRWEAGFPLQLELARTAEILHDPRGIIKAKLDWIKTNILPHWEVRLKRI